MEKSTLQRKLDDLPQNPGVYIYRDQKGDIIYIGKATNLKSRVSSYFSGSVQTNRPIEKMIHEVEDIETEQTDSVLEALILESNLIKRHQPKYNVLEKDDKSFAYFVVTKEEFPKVIIIRYTDLLKISNFKFKIKNQYQIINDKIQNRNFKYKDVLIDKYYGPYTSKYQMEIVLKIVRRIFPFHAMKQKSEKGCLDFQLGKCPGPYAGAISKEDYKKNINGIKMILEGKKKRLLTDLEKEMKSAAKKNEFEKAGELRNKIFALGHIRDVALMTRDFENQSSVIPGRVDSHQSQFNVKNTRIEAYDISNISGQHAVGSMVVFSAQGGSAFGGENWQPNKSQYRKFKIKTVEGSNDVAMMKEVLLRRFKNDWAMPDLILLDGGVGHVNMADKLLHNELGLAIDIVGVAKGPSRKNLKFEILNLKLNQEIQNILDNKLLIKNIMDEAHRFAITYHRKLRSKNALQ
jgi:excinuclease ABC subunit C